jgi:hypothetical protein
MPGEDSPSPAPSGVCYPPCIMVLKQCWNCERWLPFGAFSFTSAAHARMYHICKGCRRATNTNSPRRTYSKRPAVCPRQTPTLLELAWAAGIYEGEGSIDFNGRSLRVTVTQKDRWILDRLQLLFGGSVSVDRRIYAGRLNEVHRWAIRGARGMGFILTVFSWLSPRRRQQARTCIQGHYEAVA